MSTWGMANSKRYSTGAIRTLGATCGGDEGDDMTHGLAWGAHALCKSCDMRDKLLKHCLQKRQLWNLRFECC